MSGIPKSQKMVTLEQLRAVWKKACEFDAIAPESMFVIFSKQNPYAVEANALMLKALKQRKSEQEAQ